MDSLRLPLAQFTVPFAFQISSLNGKARLHRTGNIHRVRRRSCLPATRSCCPYE